MSNDAAPAPAAEPAVVPDTDALVKEQVTERTAKGEVLEAVVKARADAKIKRRTELLDWATGVLTTKKDALTAIVPPALGFDAEGNEVAGQYFTACQNCQRKTLKAEIAKLEAAIQAMNFDKMSRYQRKGFAD